MLIIKVKDNNLNKSLKDLKFKFSKTRVVKELQERKEFTKKSVKLRQSKLKAKYKQSKNNDDTRN